MQMMALMSQQSMAGMSAAATPPSMPPMPAINTAAVEPIDWSESMAELAQKASIEYEAEQKRSHGRTDTIHTSPLLDEEEAQTTSVLG